MTKAETINQLQSELEKLTKTLMEVNKDTFIIKDILHNSGTVAPQCAASIEILAGRSGAFKPTEIQMYGLTENGLDPVEFELLDVTIMGNPQLINYAGTTVSSQRGVIKFWNTPRPVDWGVFGSSAGQGLQIVVRNMSQKRAGKVYIHVRGYAGNCDEIGRYGSGNKVAKAVY